MRLRNLLNSHHFFNLFYTYVKCLIQTEKMMKKYIFHGVLLGVFSYSLYDLWIFEHPQFALRQNQKVVQAPPALKISPEKQIVNIDQDMSKFLKQLAPDMQQDVIQKVMMSLECSLKNNLSHQPILTVIDYSLPSNQKRLWVIDLNNKILLFHTYVAHGIRSGADFTTYFSNQYNSKASSIGVYKTKMNYFGREGSSLRLQGLEYGFNDNAEGRSIVMHGAFYVEEDFIKKYGRAGRSWGCPALPVSLSKQIIDMIKDDNLMVIYYPSEQWITKSKFLNCQTFTPLPPQSVEYKNPSPPDDSRENVLFISNSPKILNSENPPVLAVPANYYIERFKTKAPLERMIRRRIFNQEFIALKPEELLQISKQYNEKDLENLFFVIPTLTNNRGYFQTVMKPVDFGKITGFDITHGYQIVVNHQLILNLQPNNKFVRWLGL